jgi:maleylpyruvate isomerase
MRVRRCTAVRRGGVDLGLNGDMTSPTGSGPGTLVDAVQEGTRRLLRTVDAMTDAEWPAPSTLPGWSRAHVVAHLALNAEGLAAVVDGLIRQEPVPFYRSDADRDGDIEALAAEPPSELRERLLGATTTWLRAAEALPVDAAATTFERTPGGAVYPAGDIPLMRRLEIEIHHADLALGYGPPDWPADFVADLLPVLAWDRGAEHDLLLRTPDGDLPVGAGTGPVVAGSAADLTWWLLGRGAGEGLSGELPALGPWIRRPRR